MKMNFIQRLINKIKEKRKAKRINKIIRRYKFIHIMDSDKFAKPFVDFLNRNFDMKEHLVLCKRTDRDEFPFPHGENVIEIKTLLYLKFKNNEKVFFHSLFNHESVKYLYKHKDILKEKAYWQIWGGDLYNAPRDKKNDFVRENFRAYITDVDNDKVVLEKRYATRKNKKVYHATYTFPVTINMIQQAKDSLKKRNATIIQINNSCDDSTLEMLDILSKFKMKNIIVKTILSYGKLEFKQAIIDKGNAIFGDKFEFIDMILPPQDYAKYVSENDVLILNQNRQQGLGNAFLALAFGTKLYIRSEISTYDYLIQNGNKVFDITNGLCGAYCHMDFVEFIAIDKEIQQNNILNSQKFFSDEFAKKLFEKVFYDSLEYWQNRAKKHGKHSVYNMTHSIDELESVDKYQEQIYSQVLKKHLNENGGGEASGFRFWLRTGKI